MKFGAEFRAARAAAESVGAQVVLGDRPIELTLKRAWAAMGPEERGAVLLAGAALVFGGLPLQEQRREGDGGGGGGGMEGLLSSLKAEGGNAADASSTPSSTPPSPSAPELEGGYRGADDALLQSLERFGRAFPSLYEALIGERDRYLVRGRLWVDRLKSVSSIYCLPTLRTSYLSSNHSSPPTHTRSTRPGPASAPRPSTAPRASWPSWELCTCPGW